MGQPTPSATEAATAGAFAGGNNLMYASGKLIAVTALCRIYTSDCGTFWYGSFE
jgi:hypothetical protein